MFVSSHWKILKNIFNQNYDQTELFLRINVARNSKNLKGNIRAKFKFSKAKRGTFSLSFSKSTRELKSSNTAKKVQEDWKASKNYLQEKLQQSNYSRYLVFRNDLDLSKKDSFAFTGH